MKLFGLTRDATTVWRSSLFAVRLVALVMGSVAFTAALWVTDTPGPGLQYSSAAYLGAAESLVAGHGYREPLARWSDADSTTPLTRYAPGFPTAIAVPEAAGFPALDAARLVEALAAFVAMAALLSMVGDAAGAGAAVLLGVALLVSPIFVGVHLIVVSEPLLLAGVVLTLALMVGAPNAAVAIGVGAAVCMAVAYAGVSVVAAAVAWMLVRGGPWNDRVRRAAIVALPGVSVGIAWFWLVHRAIGAGAPGPGDAVGVAAAGVPAQAGVIRPLAGAAATLSHWLVPTLDAHAWVWVAAALVAAATAMVVVRGTRSVYRLWRLLPRDKAFASSTTVPQLLAARVVAAGGLMVIMYGLALVAAQVFTDRSISLGERILSPAILIASAVITVTAANWWRSAARPARAAVWLVLAAWGTASLRVSHERVHEALTSGYELGRDRWRLSPLLEWVRTDGNRRPVYTNWPAVASLYLGRSVRGVPTSGDAATLRAFGDTLARRGGGGVVLAFHDDAAPYVSGDSLVRVLGLRVLAHYPDGDVLGPPGP